MTKRFRRTKEEVALGLTPEEAQKRRANPKDDSLPNLNGFSVHFKPQSGVDTDYLVNLPKTTIVIELDEKYLAWLDDKLTVLYTGDMNMLLRHIFELGLGEVIDNVHTEQNVKYYERFVTGKVSTVEKI